MSNYDPEDHDLDAAMSGDQEADDFANFDPQRYLRRRGRPVVSDDRDEYQIGAEARNRSGGTASGVGDDPVSLPTRRTRYSSRFDPNELERLRRGGGNGFLNVILGVLVGVGKTSGCGRRALVLLGCLAVTLIAVICIGGVALVSRLLSGG